MAKILVCYFTRSKHTEHMAEVIAAGAGGVSGATVDLRPVGKVEFGDLTDYDGIVMGSPTYYGTMAAQVKQLLDESVRIHGQLAGKVGGAFSSSANVGGGNETTVLDILKAMIIHGMIVPGSAAGDHYGPVAIGDIDDRSRAECDKWGKLIAELTVKMHG